MNEERCDSVLSALLFRAFTQLQASSTTFVELHLLLPDLSLTAPCSRPCLPSHLMPGVNDRPLCDSDTPTFCLPACSMTDVASTSAKAASQAPPTPPSHTLPTCRGFKVPELRIPGTEPEEFSSKHGHSSQAHHAWSADAPRESRLLSGAFSPRLSKSAGSEGPGWERSIRSALTQAEGKDSAHLNARLHPEARLATAL